MPRNISFSLTTEQILRRTKTVTRRLGWRNLKPGTLLNACDKCMGLAPGAKPKRLATIVVTDVRRERLWLCSDEDAALEGFPHLTGQQFVEMFCEHMGCDESLTVTRIEFAYVEQIPEIISYVASRAKAKGRSPGRSD